MKEEEDIGEEPEVDEEDQEKGGDIIEAIGMRVQSNAGRCGTIIAEDPNDQLLRYKVQFGEASRGFDAAAGFRDK